MDQGASCGRGSVSSSDSRLAPTADVFWVNSADPLFSVSVLTDDDFVFREFNPAAERLTGLANATLRGRRPHEVLAAESARAVVDRYRQCLQEKRPITYVETLQFPAGESHWSTTLSPVADEHGRIVSLVGRAHQILGPDGADLMAEVELHAVLDGLPNGIALVDSEGAVMFVNAAWRRFGARQAVPSPQLGITYLGLCDLSSAAGLPTRAEVEGPLGELLAGRTEGFELRYVWRERHFLLRGSRLAACGALRVALAHTEVTDVVAAQQLLASAGEHLLQVQEEERARIAQELHDSTSQHLVAVSLGLARLRRSDAPARVLDDMRHALGEAQKEIRTLTYLLYPPKLSSQGLEMTLRSFLDGFRRRTGLSVASTTFGDIDGMALGVQRNVFRVVQESLANIHRHAGAHRVAIEVSLKRRGLHVTVADDGRRPEANTPVSGSGVGIRGMQARFAHYGGQLTVHHRAFGTVVEGFIPAASLLRAKAVSD